MEAYSPGGGMGRFQRILYLERRTGGSRRAFSCAIRVAAKHGASLTLKGMSRGRAERMLRLAALFEVPARISGPGRNVGPDSTVATHDLVITVGRFGGSPWPYRLDRLERRLLRSQACPVWILHPAQGSPVRVVLAAVDVSRPEQETLGREVLEMAADLTGDWQAELHVVHCWSVMGESLLASRSRGGGPRCADQAVVSAMRARRRQLEGLLSEGGVAGSANMLLRKDEVVAGVRDVAWRLEADVVVVGTTARTGLSGLVMGNTAERLLGRVPSSILVVPGHRA